MSVSRLNLLTMKGILPFNFGMDYDAWLSLYQQFPELCGSDPATWDGEQKDFVNAQAQRERNLCDRLMGLPDDEFRAEVERLVNEEDAA